MVYACDGNTITLPWNFVLDRGDTITEIEWYYDGASQEMIAMEAHGGFLTFPAFGNRVEQVNDAGIRLTGVLTSDSGNYTVVVNGYDAAGGHFELRDSAFVQISGRCESLCALSLVPIQPATQPTGKPSFGN